MLLLAPFMDGGQQIVGPNCEMGVAAIDGRFFYLLSRRWPTLSLAAPVKCYKGDRCMLYIRRGIRTAPFLYKIHRIKELQRSESIAHSAAAAAAKLLWCTKSSFFFVAAAVECKGIRDAIELVYCVAIQNLAPESHRPISLESRACSHHRAHQSIHTK